MRLRALALFSVASLVLLGACGDDGGDDSPEAQTFCSVVDPIQQLPTILENYEDVAGVQKTPRTSSFSTFSPRRSASCSHGRPVAASMVGTMMPSTLTGRPSSRR